MNSGQKQYKMFPGWLPGFILDPHTTDHLSPWQPHTIDRKAFILYMVYVWHNLGLVSFEVSELQSLYTQLCGLRMTRQSQTSTLQASYYFAHILLLLRSHPLITSLTSSYYFAHFLSFSVLSLCPRRCLVRLAPSYTLPFLWLVYVQGGQLSGDACRQTECSARSSSACRQEPSPPSPT